MRFDRSSQLTVVKHERISETEYYEEGNITAKPVEKIDVYKGLYQEGYV